MKFAIYRKTGNRKKWRLFATTSEASDARLICVSVKEQAPGETYGVLQTTDSPPVSLPASAGLMEF